MADYVMTEDEDQTTVVQELLANAESPEHVIWRPRSGVPHGGVYEVPDDLADKLLEHRRARAQAETDRIEAAQAAADERDSSEAVASGLVTPAEAGFAANATGDPGAAVDADHGDDEAPEDAERNFDADTLDDEAWAAKYGDEPRPDRGGSELPDPAADGEPAEDEAAKPTRSKRARRNAAAKADEAPAAPAEETK